MHQSCLLALVLLLPLVLGFRVLSGKDLPKDYPIGNIDRFDYLGNQELMFFSQSGRLGFVDVNTGLLIKVYELEADQKIIETNGLRQLVIAKGKAINVFMPKEKTYIKLHASDFLEKQNFTQIIKMKRQFNHDYILTDQFLMRAENPFGGAAASTQKKATQKYQIIAKPSANEQFYQLTLSFDKDMMRVGLLFLKQTDAKQQLCIKHVNPQSLEATQGACIDLDTKEQLKQVTGMGPYIFVFFETYKLLLDKDLKVVHESKKKQFFSFVDTLNIHSTDQPTKNLKGNSDAEILPFFNRASPRTKYSLNIFEKYFLITRDGKAVANFQKGVTDMPRTVWTINLKPDSQDYYLLVEFKNVRVDCYAIGEEKKSQSTLWSLSLTQPKVKPEPVSTPQSGKEGKAPEGEKKEATEIDLQEQQKILQKVDQQQSTDIEESKQPAPPAL